MQIEVGDIIAQKSGLCFVWGSGELLEIEMVEGFTCVNHNGVGSWQTSDLDGGCCS